MFRAPEPSTRPRTPEESAADLVEFVEGLGERGLREYAALAAKDARFGEDVAREKRETAADSSEGT